MIPKKMKKYGISTNEMVQIFHGTVDGTLLHCFLIDFVVNSHIWDP